MINKQVIENLYKKFRTAPASPDQLDLATLFEHTILTHNIYVDDGELVIDSIQEDSPFHRIPLNRIHGIQELDRVIAIVLPNAIIFLNKKDEKAHVHLRMPKMSVMDHLREKLSRNSHPDF